MQRITTFQIFCTLIVMINPIAFLEVPKRLLVSLANNAWMAVPLSLLPGLLIFLMYMYIIRHSQTPFPAMLEEHFGSVGGRLLQGFYFVTELVIAAFGIRLFVEFAETNVMPGTPISVHIALMLLVCFSAIKAGMPNFIRTFEVVFILGLIFSVFILPLGFTHPFDLENLLPINTVNIRDLAIATASTSVIVSRGFIILVLGKMAVDWQGLRRAMLGALVTYVILLTSTVLLPLLIFGAHSAQFMSFPTFMIVRVINIGDFIQNLDIIFIGIWILGMFATTTGTWFISLLSLQQALRLENYRFLAAPTALILGILSISIADNILEVQILSIAIVPLLYGLALVFIPLLMFLRMLFKSKTSNQPAKSIPVQNMD